MSSGSCIPARAGHGLLAVIVLTAHAYAATTTQTEEVTVKAERMGANGPIHHPPGGGLMPPQTAPVSRSGVDKAYIGKQTPSTNALNLLRNTPGVIVASGDPLGATDRMSVSIRGLNQNEIGYELEGMNPAYVLYYNPTASTWADTEDLASITVTPGAPDLFAPTLSAVGGLISARLRDPATRAGMLVDTTFGSNAARRVFGRVDTGTIGHTGVAAFVSMSNTHSDNWRGPGRLDRYHVDAKFVRPSSDGGKLSGFVSYNNIYENLYTFPTLAQWNALGRSYNYAASFQPGSTSYYKLRFYNWRHIRSGVTIERHPTGRLTLSATPYLYLVRGALNGASTLDPSNAFVGNTRVSPLSGLGADPDLNRGMLTALSVDEFINATFGFNSRADYRIGHHTVSAGYWYSYSDYAEAPVFEPVDTAGNFSNNWGRYPLLTSAGRPLYQWDTHFIEQSNALTLGDSYTALGDRLVMQAGLRVTMLTRHATNNIPGSIYATSFSDVQPLPRLAVSYRIDAANQIYADVTTAFREIAGVTPQIDLFSPATGRITSQHVSSYRPEYAIGEEIGYRHSGDVNLSVALFNQNLTHRQFTSSALVNGTTITSSIDAGGQTSRGVSAEFSLKPWHHLSPYISAQYLHARVDNNISAAGDLLPTRGKKAVLSPSFSGAVGLSYDDDVFFGSFTYNYVSHQYTTFMNDQRIGSYGVGNLALGYRAPSVWHLHHPQLQVNLTNIGDEKYLSGVWGLTTNANPQRGIYGTAIRGSAPTYIVGANFGVYVNLSTAID